MARIELYHNLSNGTKLHCRRLACMNWKDLQCISEPRALDLHMIPQHQFLGVGMEVHLLAYPTPRWARASTPSRIAVVVIPSFAHVRARFFWR